MTRNNIPMDLLKGKRCSITIEALFIDRVLTVTSLLFKDVCPFCKYDQLVDRKVASGNETGV